VAVTPEVCSKPICGSSWAFYHRVEAEQKTTPPVGSDRVAWELTGFANTEAPGMLKGAGAYAVVVNPKMGKLAGAQAGGCEHHPAKPAGDLWCIEVPDELERQAETFNKTQAATIGDMPRGRWRANALRILTHEAAHIGFSTKPPAGVTVSGEIIQWELDELYSILSEVPIVYAQAKAETPSQTEAETKFRRIVSTYVSRCGEGIRGILTQMRCIGPREKVQESVKAVFAAQSGKWGPEEKKLFLDEVTDPAKKLEWPT
jgi:hypothetical protein